MFCRFTTKIEKYFTMHFLAEIWVSSTVSCCLILEVAIVSIPHKYPLEFHVVIKLICFQFGETERWSRRSSELWHYAVCPGSAHLHAMLCGQRNYCKKWWALEQTLRIRLDIYEAIGEKIRYNYYGKIQTNYSCKGWLALRIGTRNIHFGKAILIIDPWYYNNLSLIYLFFVAACEFRVSTVDCREKFGTTCLRTCNKNFLNCLYLYLNINAFIV